MQWATDKRLTNRPPKQCKRCLITSPVPPLNGRIFRSRPDIRVDVSPTRASNFWSPGENIFQVRQGEVQLFIKKRLSYGGSCDIRKLATQNPCPAVDAIGSGISPLSCWVIYWRQSSSFGYVLEKTSSLANRLPFRPLATRSGLEATTIVMI